MIVCKMITTCLILFILLTSNVGRRCLIYGSQLATALTLTHRLDQFTISRLSCVSHSTEAESGFAKLPAILLHGFVHILVIIIIVIVIIVVVIVVLVIEVNCIIFL